MVCDRRKKQANGRLNTSYMDSPINLKELPLVSVIMSVFNAEHYLEESINSILQQSYKNFEFVIIDDCSTDNSNSIINSYTDSRIKLTINNENLGLTKSLNKALNFAKGKYIARMDSDDIALPERLKKQVAILEQDPEISICGSSIEQFSDLGYSKTKNYPEKHEDILIEHLFNCPFAHPSVMFRNIINTQYNTEFKTTQDYELWQRILKRGKGYNIQQVLLRYRVSDSQISKVKGGLQIKYSNLVRYQIIKELGIKLTPNEQEVYFNFMRTRGVKEYKDFRLLNNVITKIYETNHFNSKLFKKKIKDILRQNTLIYFIRENYSFYNILELFKAPYFLFQYLPAKQSLSIIIKSVIHYKSIQH
ncbi:glycosyltransferase [Labilibacter sediminis]|nr:glycosyltransferase [Labilibacter sediminis]